MRSVVQTSGDGCVQRVALALIELVPLVIEDQIQHGPLRKIRRLVDDEATASDGSAHARVPTLAWRATTDNCVDRATPLRIDASAQVAGGATSQTAATGGAAGGSKSPPCGSRAWFQ